MTFVEQMHCYHSQASLDELVANKNGTPKAAMIREMARDLCEIANACETCKYSSGFEPNVKCALRRWL